jgi:membrane dipeptidase
MNRFSYLLISLLALITTSCSNSNSDENLLKKARAIHSRIVTIDTHTDTPLMFTREGFDFSGMSPDSRGRVDLRRMEDGGLDAAFFAVFIGQGERNVEKYAEAHNRALSIFDAVHKTVEVNSDRATIALTAGDARRIKAEGKRAIYIGVENGYPIGKDLNKLADYYNLGARYLTLCHTRNNDICDSSTDPNGPEHKGLSPFGFQVVNELNRMGMMIDVSHISDDSFYQVLKFSKVPVVASHSNVRALCDNPRNLNDDMLIKLAENRGVIQMCLLSAYIKTPEPFPARDSARAAVRAKYNRFQDLEPEVRKKALEEWYAIDETFPPKLATVSDLVDHIDYVVNLVGIDYVGIGSDFDGGGAINGCADASEMINITVELLRRGYKEKDIKKIWGENFLRVFREVEQYAQNFKEE